MTESEFMQKMLAVFPDAAVGQDNDGQLVIYTSLQLTDDGQVVPFDEPNLTGV